MEENIFSLSPMDKERFGVEIGKVFITKPDLVESVLEDAAAKQAKMIIARCKAENMTAAQELEKTRLLSDGYPGVLHLSSPTKTQSSGNPRLYHQILFH